MSKELKPCPFCGVKGKRTKENSFLFEFDHNIDCFFYDHGSRYKDCRNSEKWDARPENKYKKMWDRFWNDFESVYELLPSKKKYDFREHLLYRKKIIEEELKFLDIIEGL